MTKFSTVDSHALLCQARSDSGLQNLYIVPFLLKPAVILNDGCVGGGPLQRSLLLLLQQFGGFREELAQPLLMLRQLLSHGAQILHLGLDNIDFVANTVCNLLADRTTGVLSVDVCQDIVHLL